MIQLIAFDLDGTLTQHRTPLDANNRAVLQRLTEEGYRLLMVGAGQCMRIYQQMNYYPIDIIGNYGLQYAAYDSKEKNLRILRNLSYPCDKDSVAARITKLRQAHGYMQYQGDPVEFHPSGCVTFPLLGTCAAQEQKLAFDPDRTKRRSFYQDVVRMFPEYTVFIGGSSSFDMAPRPYDKYYALDLYCKENQIAHDSVLFVGDDYGIGGNDEAVYRSKIDFLCINDYRTLNEHIRRKLGWK